MNIILFRPVALALLVCFISVSLRAQQTVSTPGVEAKLYLGTGPNQPLLVGLGGSEGGNAWASEHWRKTREHFIRNGYAFLAIGYFGSPGTPDTLNQIAIDKVYGAIAEAAKNSLIDKKKIAIIGGSRGGDLALLLGSYYPGIRCIVAMVPSHVVFPGHTAHFSTAAWSYQGKQLPFVPVNEEAIPFLLKRNLRGTFEAMLKDTLAEKKAMIQVERINGPILLLSATQDEIVPTTPMCDKIMQRLKAKSFPWHYKHLAIEGGHTESQKHVEVISQFLDTYFKSVK
ncbi:hypothetical protein GCM10028805_30980 [Spirosoma harenae]